jgi:glycosyltransferase involved in cell wall biosynthesis
MTVPASSRLPVSALVVIHNEAKLLDRCLRSCADLVDDIVVIHDGPCNDESLIIAQKYTGRIFIRPRIGEAEPHRVFGIKQCRHDWILFLDGDEFLSTDIRSHLRDWITSQTCDAYEFAWPTWYRGRYYQAFSKRALWRKSRFFFIGAPHEYAKPCDDAAQICRVSSRLEHKPLYDNITWQKWRSKWLPWAKIHASYYQRPFSSLETYNCSLKDWEPVIRYRLKYPLLLGVCGSFGGLMLLGLWQWLRHPHYVFLKSTVLMALYHSTVYYYAWKQHP